MTTELVQSSDRKAITDGLQSVLYYLIDATLLTKQVHWNLKGPNFRSVHLQLDEIVADLRNYSDEIAERLTTIGVPAAGTATAVSANSERSGEADWVLDSDGVELISRTLTNAAEKMRMQIQKVGDLDPISEDILIEATRGIEKHDWMLRSQI